ncbi:MAG: glutamate ligase domain-containing protein [Thioalkalivibrionaceae bacterium]
MTRSNAAAGGPAAAPIKAPIETPEHGDVIASSGEANGERRRHIHILGIGGTFMAGIAQLARASGWHVTGRDGPLWPPMSDQLERAGIEWAEDLRAQHPEPFPEDADIVVGNVCTRGMPIIEKLLDSGRPYQSGPEWLARNVLVDRWVVAIAGTHGKTTTASLVAHILDRAGLAPGFLIGGVPKTFGCSARLGSSPFFVVEADEYDSAFFDKRAKFVHYRPRTLIINNLEHDHADIYPDLASIQRQFHHLIRTVPAAGAIIVPHGDHAVEAVLQQGCWTPVVRVAIDETHRDDQRPRDTLVSGGVNTVEGRIDTRASMTPAPAISLVNRSGGRVDVVSHDSDRAESTVTGTWPLAGRHNRANLVAALAAARHAGVPLEAGLAAASDFTSVARRLDVLGEVRGIVIVDDFAHHPTAVTETLAAARERWPDHRVVAIVEPRSNTMRMGAHADALADALAKADSAWLLREPSLAWDTSDLERRLGDKLHVCNAISALLNDLCTAAEPRDVLLVMSNGSFGGLHRALLECLTTRSTTDQAVLWTSDEHQDHPTASTNIQPDPSSLFDSMNDSTPGRPSS